MPQKNQPERLEDLALKCIAHKWLKIVAQNIIRPVYIMQQRDFNMGQLFLNNIIKEIQDNIFSYACYYNVDKVAEELLKSVEEIISECKLSFSNTNDCSTNIFYNKMKIAVGLCDVAMHPNVKQLTITNWPKIMQHVLYNNLYKMKGIKHLDLGYATSGWETTDLEKHILPGLENMANLTYLCLCFDCTDAIIAAIGDKCPSLQILDITASRSVTDRSTAALAKCKQLVKVNLYKTSITEFGYRDLLLELPSLQSLGRVDMFGSVLILLNALKPDPLALRSVYCTDLTMHHMDLLVDYCPNLTSVWLFHVEIVSDLENLKKLKYLKDIYLTNVDFYSDKVKDLLEHKGEALESIRLDYAEEIDCNALICISQFCPNLKSLSFHNCEFSAITVLNFEQNKLPIPPFACLEELVCICDCLPEHLMFLMVHCKQVKFIRLSFGTCITDRVLAAIIKKNPLKSLETLIIRSCNLSMQSVDLLMENCDQLCKLDLSSWSGISPQDLRDFQHYISSHNINLSIQNINHRYLQ